MILDEMATSDFEDAHYDLKKLAAFIVPILAANQQLEVRQSWSISRLLRSLEIGSLLAHEEFEERQQPSEETDS